MELQAFTQFYPEWIDTLKNVLVGLEVGLEDSFVYRPTILQGEIAETTKQFSIYYMMKWGALRADPKAFLSQKWLNPNEKKYQWMTGYKPRVLFILLEKMRRDRYDYPFIDTLSGNQLDAIEELKEKIMKEEEHLNKELKRPIVWIREENFPEVQRLLAEARKKQEASAKAIALLKKTRDAVLRELQRIVRLADNLRIRALRMLLEILTPVQSVEFLAFLVTMHISIREEGEQAGNQN